MRRTARKAVPLRDRGERAVEMFRAYHPSEEASVERTLNTYHQLWSRARDHGVSDLEAIQRLVEILPEDWQIWAGSLADDYIWRDPVDHSEQANFSGFYHHIHEHYDSYRMVMPASPPNPPDQVDPRTPIVPAAPGEGPSQWYHGEGSQPLRPEVVRDFPSPQYDPTGRGKGPASSTHSNGYETDAENEPWRRNPAFFQQTLEETIPRIVRPMLGEFQGQVNQAIEGVNARLDHLIENLGPMVHPVPEAPIPPHVMNWLPGGVHFPIVLSSDDDSDSDVDPSDFEGSSGLSSVDNDEEIEIV